MVLAFMRSDNNHFDILYRSKPGETIQEKTEGTVAAGSGNAGTGKEKYLC